MLARLEALGSDPRTDAAVGNAPRAAVEDGAEAAGATKVLGRLLAGGVGKDASVPAGSMPGAVIQGGRLAAAIGTPPEECTMLRMDCEPVE